MRKLVVEVRNIGTREVIIDSIEVITGNQLNQVNTTYSVPPGIRRAARKKASAYIIYSLILVVLMIALYIMIRRIPVGVRNIDVLGAYSFMGIISITTPIHVIRNMSHSYSKIAITLTISIHNILYNDKHVTMTTTPITLLNDIQSIPIHGPLNLLLINIVNRLIVNNYSSNKAI